MLAGDKSTIIKTENYDIKLAKRSIKDLIVNEKSNDTKFPLGFHDIARLVEDTNITERSVLGLTVTYLLSIMQYWHHNKPLFPSLPVRRLDLMCVRHTKGTRLMSQKQYRMTAIRSAYNIKCSVLLMFLPPILGFTALLSLV